MVDIGNKKMRQSSRTAVIPSPSPALVSASEQFVMNCRSRSPDVLHMAVA